jgi:hypothetical protein
MKRLMQVLALLFAFVPAGFAANHYSGPRTHGSRKSHVAGSHDGTYPGGRGASHKGGHYKNSHTRDHYRDRQHGIPR